MPEFALFKRTSHLKLLVNRFRHVLILKNALRNCLMCNNGAMLKLVTHLHEFERLHSDLANATDRTKRVGIQKDKLQMDAKMDLARRAFHK